MKRLVMISIRHFVVVAAALHAASLPLAATAFDELSPAQTLIYDTTHLEDTMRGDELAYRYRRDEADADPVEGEVTMTVVEETDAVRRKLKLDFLSGEHRMPLPEFDGYRGNPVIIVMLEHVSRELAAITGGGALYFRNRIRDALADPELRIEPRRDRLGEREIASRHLVFSPFVGDPYLQRWPALAAAVFDLALSEEVPGDVLAMEVNAADQADSPFFRASLHLDPDDPAGE